jgi:putative cell wall-binding protein
MNYADSLSASSTGLPILLINNSKKDLTTEQKEFLAQRDSWKFYILGSEAAVCKEFETVLGEYGEVVRVSGSVREETSIEIAKTFCPKPSSMALAFSQDFPDGLCGGVLAYNIHAPLVLARTSEKIEKLVGEYAREYGISRGVVLGSSKLISDDTTIAIFQK